MSKGGYKFMGNFIFDLKLLSIFSYVFLVFKGYEYE